MRTDHADGGISARTSILVVRGPIPTPGPELAGHGGHTSCVARLGVDAGVVSGRVDGAVNGAVNGAVW